MPNTRRGVARMRTGTTVQSAAIGHPAYSQTMPCEAASAHWARELVIAALNTWRLGSLADAATLVVSELVTNAVLHSESRDLRVTVARTGPVRVRVAVVDRSRTGPVHRVAADEDEDGRGLDVVDALSERWGSDPLPWGKRVWAEVSCGSRPLNDDRITNRTADSGG